MTAPLVLFGDVEHTVIEYLDDELAGNSLAAGVVLGTQIPDRPEVFVLVRRVGGLRERLIDRARLDVQVWHRTDTQAHDLMDLVLGLLWQAKGLGALRGVTGSTSPTYVPDPDSGASRYLSTVDLTVKGAPA